MFFKVVDKFLPKQVFNRLLDTVESDEFEWQWSNSSAYDYNLHGDNNFMLNKMIYNNAKLGLGFHEDKKYSQLFYLIKDFQDYIKPSRDLIRMKLNLYTNQGKNVEMKPHKDYVELNYDFKTCVFNLTTCNGGTVLLVDDKEILIPSVENQLIVMDGNIEHFGITQTDKKTRVLINYNFS